MREDDTSSADASHHASAAPDGHVPTGWAEVRLLGPLRVRLDDGTTLGERDWRTGKNADLLRWLALHVGEVVAVDTLADGLWPGTDEGRSRSSLRTAVAHLRRLLGADVLERRGEGLVLTGCWVDVPAFVRLAEDADRHRRAGRHVDTWTAAIEADALYLADVAVGPGSPAAVAEQASALRTLHQRVLGDAAEAALALSWWRDAVDLARRVLDADPVDERASRVLMLALAGLGEFSHALAEYARCRQVLADELGVDPSPQTQAAHLQVLRPAPPARTALPFVGRRSELAWLVEALGEAVEAAEDGVAPPVLVVRGGEGSGRRRLVQAACRTTGVRVTQVQPDEPLAGALAEAAGTPPGREPTAGDAQAAVVLWRPDPDTDLRSVAAVLNGSHGRSRAPVVVVVALPCEGELPALDDLLARAAARTLQLRPLVLDEVATLARHVLGGPPTVGMVEELHRAGDGLPGPVLAQLRAWQSAGIVVATSAGVALAPRVAEQEQDRAGRRALAAALPRLDGDALDAVQVAAFLDEPLTPSLLAPLLTDDAVQAHDTAASRARARSVLERLVDLGLLHSSPAGAVWHHPLMQDAVRAWVRPATARRLHARIAGRARISSSARVAHWLHAGERELACVAALDAAEECAARDDHAGARTHLLEVCSLGDLPEASAEDRADLFEALGDACRHLQRPEEAVTAYRQALDVALTAMLPRAGRLRRKLRDASDPRALELLPPGRAVEHTSALDGFGAPAGAAGDLARVEAYLTDAVQLADRRRDLRRAVEGRLQLAAGVALPRRDFRGVHQWVEAAMSQGPTRPTDRLRAVLVRQLTPVLLGGAATARGPLDEAARAAEEAEDHPLRWRLLGMRVLVAHDLGLPDLEDLLLRLDDRVRTGGPDETLPELAAIALRVFAEREEVARATEMAAHVGGARLSSLQQHLVRLGLAELAEAEGDHRRASELLQSVVAEGLETGCTLFVPEAAARVVVLEAGHDASAARTAFEVYDEVVGAAVGGPREEFWRRLSRAAVRGARGDVEGAAGSAAQAAQLAARHGLQVLTARARRARAAYERDARQPRRVPSGTTQRIG